MMYLHNELVKGIRLCIPTIIKQINANNKPCVYHHHFKYRED